MDINNLADIISNYGMAFVLMGYFLLKDWKFNERPYCSARSAYGFLSFVGFGCDTSIFLIFKALLFLCVLQFPTLEPFLLSVK